MWINKVIHNIIRVEFEQHTFKFRTTHFNLRTTQGVSHCTQF